MTKEIVKEYSNGELSIIWKPQLCIHAGECVKALPSVYKPNEKPWITAENATTQELKDQIAKCPSGALSYRMDNEDNNSDPEVLARVEVKANGPLLVHGTLQISDPDGKEEIKNPVTAFCRCGASQNKPYCDGAHVKAEFKG
ncbi:MAG: (4Fe-4S)-binding protein [Bacteroidota bacterium]